MSRPISARLLPLVGLVLLACASSAAAMPASSPGRRAPVVRRAPVRRLSLQAGASRRLTLRARGAIRLGRLRVAGLPPGIELRVRRVRRGRLWVLLRAAPRTPTGGYVMLISAPRRQHRRREARREWRLRIALTVRASAAAAARGSDPAAPTPTSSAAEDPGPVADHIATWAYDDSLSDQWCNGGAGASPQLVRAWLTYAESNCGPLASKAQSDCAAGGVTYCTTIQYLDASRIYRSNGTGILAAAQESWWLHQPGYHDANHRLTVPGWGGGYLLDQANPAVQDWFRGYVRSNYDELDGLMLDEMATGLRAWLWGSGYQTSEELGSDAQVNAAHEQLAGALTHANGSPFLEVYNGISPNPWLPTPFSLLGHPASVVGLVSEGVPEDYGQLTPYYATMLDEMAYVDHTASDFIVLLSYANGGSPQARRVQAASVLLGYSPHHTVSWSALEQDSYDLAVWPEEGIVPSDPLQTMAEPGGSGCLAGDGELCSQGGHNDLEVASGVYRREFAECYDRGVAFGPCAVIVNTSGDPITVQRSWLRGDYGHEITFRGGDVQSGGTLELAGAPFSAGSTQVPPRDALLLSS